MCKVFVGNERTFLVPISRFANALNPYTSVLTNKVRVVRSLKIIYQKVKMKRAPKLLDR